MNPGAWLEVLAARLTGATRRAQEPRSLYYVVTNLRAMIITTGPVFRIRSFAPNEIGPVSLHAPAGRVYQDVEFGVGRFIAVENASFAASFLRGLRDRSTKNRDDASVI